MSIRRSIPWLLYAVCALAVLEGVGYAGYKALDLQRQRREEEAVRLALWRMDSALTAVLATESARPYFHYRPFHPAERAYSAMLGPIEPGEVLVPSPLLTQVPPFVRLHFEVGPDGELTSPQAPAGNLRDLAEAEYVAADDVITAEALRLMLLELLEGQASAERSASELGFLPTEKERAGDWLARNEFAAAARLVPSQDHADGFQRELAGQGPSPPAASDDAERFADRDRPAQRVLEPQQRRAPMSRTVSDLPEVSPGPLSAAWLKGEELVLTREVIVGQTRLRQGVWLDWPSLHDWLVAQVEDLVPGAELEPGGGQARALAVLPATLRARADGGLVSELASPLGVVLMLTWMAAMLAIIAIGIVLRLAISLAERRGRFVSAVTHELRTPMTSVRLYADLLDSEAADDEERRRRFVATLRSESARLARIIENVLAYARLGRPQTESATPASTVADLVERSADEQAQALARASMRLEVAIDQGLAGRTLDADGDAVTRVLGNLIENACKYASGGDCSVVELHARRRGGLVAFTVRDHGPGVPERERRRIFEPFHRASRDELRESGLGLGLAIGRGLARQMGGRLMLEDTATGACFTLTVPLADSTSKEPRANPSQQD